MHNSRARVKGFVSYAAPFGGTPAAILPRTSGELAALVPPELLTGVSFPIAGFEALVRGVTWNGVKGLASLAMMLPYSTAYANGTDPVSASSSSAACGGRTYTLVNSSLHCCVSAAHQTEQTCALSQATLTQRHAG